MIKNTILSVGLALLLVFSLLTPSHSVLANEIVGTCSMTIDANKHSFGNYAQATGNCNGYVEGYFVSDDTGYAEFVISGSYTGETYNGHKVEIPIRGKGWHELTVKTVALKQPKPQPKPEPKPEPKPQPKPEPQPESKSQPKQESKTKQEPKETPKQTSKPANNTKTNSEGKNTTTTAPVSNTTEQPTKEETTTPQNEKPIEEKPKQWTVTELKEAEAKVIEEDEKYFAIVDEENLKKEITKADAQDLGYEIEEEISLVLEKEEEEEETEEESPIIEEPNQRSLTLPIALSAMGLVLVTGLGLAYLHPNGKIFYHKVFDKIKSIFKK